MSGYEIPDLDTEDHIMFDHYLEHRIEAQCDHDPSVTRCDCSYNAYMKLEKRRKKIERFYAETGRWPSKWQ